MSASKKKKSSFNIPQLTQKIQVNCLKLDDVQLSFLEKALTSKTKIMFVNGPAGATKTYMAVYSALRLLSSSDKMDMLYVRTIIESAAKGMGALPGDLDEKFNPYMLPLLDKLDEMLPKNTSLQHDLLSKGRIAAMPINFLRGASWINKVIVADEAQNFTFSELTTLITRLGTGSKLFICGDSMQSDIHKSGFMDMCDLFNDSKSRQRGIEFFQFTEADIKRSSLLKFIVTKLKEHKE
jgi:phosphate starvation-inducible PhoH-like protein